MAPGNDQTTGRNDPLGKPDQDEGSNSSEGNRQGPSSAEGRKFKERQPSASSNGQTSIGPSPSVRLNA